MSKELASDVSFYINPKGKELFSSILDLFTPVKIVEDLREIDKFDRIIIDVRSLDDRFYSKYLRRKNIIAIDEGGSKRDEIPYLLDTLPLPKRFSTPNISSVSFLDLPKKVQSIKNKKVLLSFGGEDPSDLSFVLINSLKNKNEALLQKITLILGPLYKGLVESGSFEIIRNPPSLANVIASSSGVITSYGLTAYETNHLETPLLLINPSEYHQELSDLIPFPSAGTIPFDLNKIIQFIENPQYFKTNPISHGTESLGDFINELASPPLTCPSCESQDFIIIERFKWRTYCQCMRCSLLFMLDYMKEKTLYNKEYFFENYEKQYGKTYVEDFSHLESLAKSRVSIIKKIAKRQKKLLDIGCAYGPFLKVVREEGIKAFGTDISEDAVSFVKKELNIDALCCGFDDFEVPEAWNIEKFDIISMWFVIEHFEKLKPLLLKINNQLNLGGMFCFSTPNASGISAKNNFTKFLKNSPLDHFTIWCPKNSAKVLHLYGFEIRKIKITGHHPERFKSFIKNSKLGMKILCFYSNLFRLGDTYEVYAEKVREL